MLDREFFKVVYIYFHHLFSIVFITIISRKYAHIVAIYVCEFQSRKCKFLFLTKFRSTSSGTLLEELQRALAALCENITGAFVTARASVIVLTETWERSTSMPSRFSSRTTALPNGERPSLWKSEGASEFGSSTEHESALKIRTDHVE